MGWLVWAILFVATTAISYIMRPKVRTPQREAPKPAGIDEYNFPTAQVGRSIQVVYGTRWVDGPNVTWYGDLKTTPVTETTSGGGKK